jgi:hypothetical protein
VVEGFGRGWTEEKLRKREKIIQTDVGKTQWW